MGISISGGSTRATYPCSNIHCQFTSTMKCNKMKDDHDYVLPTTMELSTCCIVLTLV